MIKIVFTRNNIEIHAEVSVPIIGKTEHVESIKYGEIPEKCFMTIESIRPVIEDHVLKALVMHVSTFEKAETAKLKRIMKKPFPKPFVVGEQTKFGTFLGSIITPKYGVENLIFQTESGSYFYSSSRAKKHKMTYAMNDEKYQQILREFRRLPKHPVRYMTVLKLFLQQKLCSQGDLNPFMCIGVVKGDLQAYLNDKKQTMLDLPR